MNFHVKKVSMTAASMVAVAALALAGCGGSSDDTTGSDESESDAFVAGGLFPLTGSLAFLGPPEVAAFKLAIQDINDAGGVLDKDIEDVQADVSDADHADQNTAGAQSVLSKNPSVILGPASSSVVKNVYKEISEAKVPIISMGATSTNFSGFDDYFFRTVPPDTVQGAVLGNVVADDGVKKLAIACFNDEYGTSLRDVLVQTVKDAGVEVVYGETDTFDPTETNFSSLVSEIKATSPDRIAVIAFDQTKSIVKELAGQGVDTSKLYFVDGNTADYSEDLEAGLLKGSKGTIPGAKASDDFQSQLEEIDDTLTTFTYAAETYDGLVLAALAAEKGGAVDGETIQKNLLAVSGADGGEECTTYADCVKLVQDGKDIQYKGQAGIGPLNDNHDPSTANIGIWEFDENNVPQQVDQLEGEVPAD